MLGVGVGLDWLAIQGQGFSPALLAMLAVWLDPRYRVYVERTSPTTPCGDNDPVGTWIDWTGKAFAAPSNAARPTYKWNGGKPYLQPDGVDDCLIYNGTIYTGAVATIGLAARTPASNPAVLYSLLDTAANSNINRRAFGFNSSSAWFASRDNGGGSLAVAKTAFSDDAAVVTQFNGASSLIALNNGALVTGTMSADASVNGTPVVVGARYSQDQFFWPTRIHGIVIANSVVPAWQLALLGTYLKGLQ